MAGAFEQVAQGQQLRKAAHGRVPVSVGQRIRAAPAGAGRSSTAGNALAPGANGYGRGLASYICVIYMHISVDVA